MKISRFPFEVTLRLREVYVQVQIHEFDESGHLPKFWIRTWGQELNGTPIKEF